MIRYFKPRRIYEIGSGYSTYLSAQAVRKNVEQDRSYQCELVAIEPYPNEILRGGFLGLCRLIAKQVQDVTLSEFEKLEENDILFIDSSHVLKIASDVQYEYLDILPRLNKGVIVHFHDIFLPKEYPKEWVLQLRIFWTEQYLLQAFLAFNESFEILWAGSYMHFKQAAKLESAFNSYDRNKTLPGSFWMRRTK
jgi:predicted O-methyltransferase YrrM